MNHVALYVRVSTIMQADKSSLSMQKKDLISYCSVVLGTDSYEIFEDAGFSGKNTDRPAFQNMMSKIRKGEFTHLLVWKLDRISRNLLDFAQMYSELKQLNVIFVSKNESFDTSTAMGEAMLKIVLVFAELERNMTSERVTATMISRASSGAWNGSEIPYGYDYDKTSKTFSINPEEEKVCKLIFTHLKETKNLSEVARRLNASGIRTRKGSAWIGNSIKRILTSPFTYGDYVYNVRTDGRKRINPEEKQITMSGHHPPILSSEERAVVDEIIQSRTTHPHTYASPEYPFRGLVICGGCGRKMYPYRCEAPPRTRYAFTCPICRATKKPYHGRVSDLMIGNFVFPILSGLARVQEDASLVSSAEELEKLLLVGKPFQNAHIDSDDLDTLFRSIGKESEDMKIDEPEQQDVELERASLMESIKVERRALERLQYIYLYDDSSMTEQAYMLKHNEITSKISKLEAMLSNLTDDTDDSIDYMASHLLMQAYLLSDGIRYKDIAKTVSVSVIQDYLVYTIKNICMLDKRMTRLTLYNGLQINLRYEN